ncbi:trimethylamine methyltransferase family protein [uncultured Tateyamaria sp.]|uniref:trimethylamine methyltransferase family protein n=1 Tax=uncultured Tateyamaria sp. TaxID=455651 RepID=UPI002619DA82|nr:trimethylamine methyltransferase family protein [uncultured Tateyamaria sp.]
MTDQPRRRRGRGAPPAKTRQTDYRRLRNPFPPMDVFPPDRIAAMHDAALDVLERLGIKVLLPAAREVFRKAGARVDEDTEMVHIGRDIIEAALATAPKSFPLIAGHPDRDQVMELGSMIFQPGAGCPHATDLERGRRPGTEQDFRELISLTQHFDVLHMIPPLVEPQDVPIHLRHYAMTLGQMELTDKVPFIYSRGTGQVTEAFEMLQIARGLSDAEFAAASHCYTIINTNSPRQLDIPMALGVMDFARAGQMAIITPFTLMGAMAPITVAGAMTLSHAEALAAIALGQLVNPGAPVCYGTFTSNVDMKSGAPIFGTPEHFKASLAAGQLARHIGLPWRCASGSAANLGDAQAANETQFGTWGCLLAGATVTLHAAGWLEGGLSVSYEKLITDVEVLQMVAELCTATAADDADIALDALEEVQPGGHFFGAAHTMERYQTEFYEPVVADFANIGTWEDRGSVDATHRATDVWKGILRDFTPPPNDADRLEALRKYIADRSAAGGCAPEN